MKTLWNIGFSSICHFAVLTPCHITEH